MKQIEDITRALQDAADPAVQKSAQRFFTEEVHLYGVRTPVVRKIAERFFQHIKQKKKKDILDLCDALLASSPCEETTVAFQWAWNIRKQLTAKDFPRFERWVKHYLKNWYDTDDLCTHALGFLLLHNPELTPKVFAWTTSKNLWVRRAAAVSLIYPIRKDPAFLPHIFDTAATLLQDREDLVQKGYGWMLKEAANRHPAAVFRFVLKHKQDMPRTALRYAIEKYPKAMRKEAMT